MKRPQFSLRIFLIAVTLLCICLGWLSYQFYWIAQRHEVAQRHRVGTSISILELGNFPPGVNAAVRDWPVRWTPPSPPAPLPLRWLGENGYSYVLVERTQTQAEFDRIAKFFPEAQTAWMRDK
jgi:hypothetical protein